MNLKIEICKLQIKESHARRKWVVAHPSRRYAPPPIPPCPLPPISKEIEGARIMNVGATIGRPLYGRGFPSRVKSE